MPDRPSTLKRASHAVGASLTGALCWLSVAASAGGPERETLRAIQAEAGAMGLEIGLDGRYSSPPDRPLLVPLAAVHAPAADWSWTADFERGARSCDLGVPPGLDPSPPRWTPTAEPGRRVAIAFSRADLPLATAARRALGDDHTVFTYLQPTHEEPLVSPEDAGRYFAEADIRLAVLSENAWTSGSVGFEAKVLRQVTGIEPSPTARPPRHRPR